MGWLLLLPALALLLALTLYPVLYGAWLSLFAKHSFFPEQNWVGLGNYAYHPAGRRVLGERLARHGLCRSSTIVLQIVLGLAAALVLNEMFPGRNLLRAIVLFPYVIPTVVAVILWKWLLNSQFGLVNYMLEDAGLIDRPISWMGATGSWSRYPRERLAVLSLRGDRRACAAAVHSERALRGRDRRRRDAWQRFRHVTLPQLKSVLFVIVLLRSIWMFTKFDTPWLMIQGGGAEPTSARCRSTPTCAPSRIYEAGKGAAMAVLMFLMLAAASAVYFRVWKREENL